MRSDMIAACLRSTQVSTVPNVEQHADRVADEDEVDDEVLDHARTLSVAGDRGEQRLGIGDRRRLREAGLEAR